ncbi:MAG: YraN family protein [Bacteroidetes bacterium]|jgi:putative endonuclease|nr:YraN family protein [Bacteroidota bacterium]
MAQHNKLGKQGEEWALKYLKENGFEIIHTNWRWKHKEIDLIAIDGDELVFCEVKTRSSNYFQTPADTISTQKQHFLIDAADYYITENDINLNARFDVLVIYTHRNPPQVVHIKDAFLPEPE